MDHSEELRVLATSSISQYCRPYTAAASQVSNTANRTAISEILYNTIAGISICWEVRHANVLLTDKRKVRILAVVKI